VEPTARCALFYNLESLAGGGSRSPLSGAEICEVRMRLHWRQIQRTSSSSCALVGIALLACAAFWPPRAADFFRSPRAAVLLGVWFCGSAVLLHPEVPGRLAQAWREFQKATIEVSREIRGDDDDDDPHGT